MASKYCVTAVEKAIKILNYLGEHPGATFTEIFTNLDLSKSTTYQTLFTLESYQYVTKTNEKKYRLDVGILPLIKGITDENRLIKLATGPLNRLAEETGFTVHLCSTTEAFRAICVYKIDGVNFTIKNTGVGRDLDLHTSAAAKVLLAWMDPKELTFYLSTITYTKYTNNTITSPVDYRQELIETKKRGYSIDNGEGNNGAIGIGVPIFDASGNVLAAISIGAIVTEIPPEQYDLYAEKLKKVSQEISNALAF